MANQKAKRFELYRAVGTTHYGFMWVSNGLFRNPEKITVKAPSANGPWFFSDGTVCPHQYQQIAKRAAR